MAALASPHGIDRYLASFDPMWRLDAVTARVVAANRETADAVTLTLEPNRNWRGFRAGQYVRIGFEIDGIRRTRCYSLSSSPDRASGLLDVTVKRHPHGLVSGFVQEHVRPGTIVTLSEAAGDFTLPEPFPSHVLFLCGGSGITPVMSMLRTLLDRGHQGRIDLIHFARRRADVMFARELHVRARAHPSFRLHLSLTGEPPAAGDLAGHFTEELLARAVPTYANAEAWVCGPEGLVDAVAATWDRHGRGHELHVERFTAAPRPPAADATGGTVRFARSGRVVVSDGRSLLVQAEAAGLAPKSGCRMGICRTCLCPKPRGTVRDLVTGALSSEAEVAVRLCVSIPVGDVTLDL
ncbi:MAG: ferredoxin reductase [Candidatus Binatia bacterium]